MQDFYKITSVFLKSSTDAALAPLIQLKVSAFLHISTLFYITILSGTWSNDFNLLTPKIKAGSFTATQYSALNPKQVEYDSMSYACFLDQVGKILSVKKSHL